MNGRMFDSAPAYEVKSNQSKGQVYAEQKSEGNIAIDRRAEAKTNDSGSRR